LKSPIEAPITQNYQLNPKKDRTQGLNIIHNTFSRLSYPTIKAKEMQTQKGYISSTTPKPTQYATTSTHTKLNQAKKTKTKPNKQKSPSQKLKE
jgi:hypothetical protein